MPLKDPEKRRAYDRKRKKKEYEKEKQAKRKLQAKQMSIEIRKGNLNFDPLTKVKADEPLTWKEWHKEHPNNDFINYTEYKGSLRRQYKNIERIHRHGACDSEAYPMYDNDCVKFRDQVSSNERTLSNASFWNNHMSKCGSCNAWFLVHKPFGRGFGSGNIWKKPDEMEKNRPSEEELNETLHEVLEEDYGRDY